MNRLIAILLAICLVFSITSVYGADDNYIYYHLDFDGTEIGGSWGGSAWNNTEEIPTLNTNGLLFNESKVQITKTPGVSSAPYGEFVLYFDIFPTTTKIDFNMQLRTFNNTATSNSNLRWNSKAVYFKSSGLLTANNSGAAGSSEKTIGYYVENKNYKFKINLNSNKKQMDVYLLDGYIKQSSTSEEEHITDLFVGTFALPSDTACIGALYFNGSAAYLKGENKVYLDNIKLTVPKNEIVPVTNNSFNCLEEGSKEITTYTNQWLNTATMNNLIITKNGSILPQSEYSVSYNGTMTSNSTIANSPIFTFTTPLVKGDVLDFDFSNVTDSYGRKLTDVTMKIICGDISDIEEIQSVGSSLYSIIEDLNPSANLAELTESITLPSESGNIEIEWIESSIPEYLALDGTVQRPPYSENDTTAQVTLTALLKKGNFSEEYKVTATVLMSNPSEDYIILKDAAEYFKKSFKFENNIILSDMTLPIKFESPSYTGNFVNISYSSDKECVTVDENGNLKVSRKEITDFSQNTDDLDIPVTVTALLSYGQEVPIAINTDAVVIHKNILSGKGTSVLTDSRYDTALNINGDVFLDVGENVIIGAIKAYGCDDVVFEFSKTDSDYKPAESFPVNARYIKLTAQNGNVYEVEAITSIKDIAKIKMSELSLQDSLTNITANYITLPKQLSEGIKIIWNTSNERVIDKYGTVYKSAEKKSVRLTATAVDENGNIIDGIEKYFDATVAATTTASSSSSGGGGGGSSSHSGSGGGFTATVPVDSTPTQNLPRFSDTSTVDWAVEAIEYLAKEGIINGKTATEFAPNDTILKEEFVKIIVNAFKLEKSDTIYKGFKDVSENDWYYPYIKSASACGVATGDGESFGIGNKITRQDMSVILKRAMDYKGITFEEHKTTDFNDLLTASDYAVDAIKSLSSFGIINGYTDNTFKPYNTATRAEAAKMIYSIIK